MHPSAATSGSDFNQGTVPIARQTLTALYDSYDNAADAVRKLETLGVPHTDISIVFNDASHRQYHSDLPSGDATGAGASLGTVLGGGAGLLAGLGLLAIPGLGPVVALTGAGVSHGHAASYAEGVRRGGTLVTARVDEALEARAVEILDRDGSVDMDQREAAWRGEGWISVARLRFWAFRPVGSPCRE